MNSESSPRFAVWLMVLSAAGFAAMSAIGHELGKAVSWQVVVFIRTVATVVLSACLVALHRPALNGFVAPALWVRSIAGALGILCTFYAITHLTVAESATLTNTCPIWVSILQWGWTGRRPPLSTWCAVALGIAGIAILQQPRLGSDIIGTLAGLGSATFLSVAMMSLHHLKRLSPVVVVLHFSSVAMTTCAIILWLSGNSAQLAELADFRLLALALGVGLAGTVGQMAMTRAFALGDPPTIATVSLVQIVFSIVFDWLCWGRVLSPQAAVGIFMIVVPVAWLIRHPLPVNGRAEERQSPTDRNANLSVSLLEAAE